MKYYALFFSFSLQKFVMFLRDYICHLFDNKKRMENIILHPLSKTSFLLPSHDEPPIVRLTEEGDSMDE